MTNRVIVPSDNYAIETMQRMRKMVYDSGRNPAFVRWAWSIVDGIDGFNMRAQSYAIRAFLQSHIRFVKDPFGVQTLATPEYYMTEISKAGHVQGDCAHVATLGAALANAIGIHGRFEAVAFKKFENPLEHVFTILSMQNGDIDLDIQGRRPSLYYDVTRRVLVEF